MRFVSLLSSGTDSPVATHLMLKGGHEGVLLHMDGGRFFPERENEKARKLACKLEGLHPGRVEMFRSPHHISLEGIMKNSNRKYTCLLCKRSMLMVADGLCEKVNAEAIVMGDSLGQVASQTLANLSAVSAGIKHHIIRPLIGYDKVEIEKIARDIGTDSISFEDIGSCKAAPRFPITNVKPSRLEEEEKKSDLTDLVERVLDGTTGLNIGRHR